MIRSPFSAIFGPLSKKGRASAPRCFFLGGNEFWAAGGHWCFQKCASASYYIYIYTYIHREGNIRPVV